MILFLSAAFAAVGAAGFLLGIGYAKTSDRIEHRAYHEHRRNQRALGRIGGRS